MNRYTIAQELYAEAEHMRRWADSHLPELQRVGPYVQAARLDQLAQRMQTERRSLRSALRTMVATLHDVLGSGSAG